MGGIATQAYVGYPRGVAVDNSGNVYISENGYGSRIFKVTTDGILHRIAGSNTTYPYSYLLKEGYNGDNIPAIDALLNGPGDIAINRNEEIIFIDESNYRVRK